MPTTRPVTGHTTGHTTVHTGHPHRSGRPLRRVRHEVRDGLAVVAFSALASTGLAVVLLLLLTWAGAGSR